MILRPIMVTCHGISLACTLTSTVTACISNYFRYLLGAASGGISGEWAEAYDFRLRSSSVIDSRSISCWRAGCKGYARPCGLWPCASWIRGSPRLRWAPAWDFPPRRCGRSASGILMADWSGRCSMPPVRARLRRLIRNNSSALSRWSARRLQRGGRVGRCGC